MAYPTPRSWFVSESNDHLVQIQADRLVFNWRGGGGQYPRYDTLRPRFDALFGAWSEFLEHEGLGRPVPEQIEVAYVNTIESSGIGKVLLGFDVPALEPGGVAMQDHFVASQRIPDGEGTAMPPSRSSQPPRPIGRSGRTLAHLPSRCCR